MGNFEKNTITSFRKIKNDIDRLNSQIREIKDSQKEIMDLLIKTKEEEDEQINEVKEKVEKNIIKKKKR